MVSSGLLRRVALVRTDVSEEPGASVIRVTKILRPCSETPEYVLSSTVTVCFLFHELEFVTGPRALQRVTAPQ
jgi:hypothetical protein